MSLFFYPLSIDYVYNMDTTTFRIIIMNNNLLHRDETLSIKKKLHEIKKQKTEE